MSREYKLFEPADEQAQIARDGQFELFMDGKITNPQMEYPLLDQDEVIADAVDSAKAIIAGSRALQAATGHAERYAAGTEITSAGLERYGNFDPALFQIAFSPAVNTVASFSPSNLHAEMTKENVLRNIPEFGSMPSDREQLINQELLERCAEGVRRHIAPMMDVLPDTDSSVKYGSDEIKTHFEHALVAMGLAEQGWTVEISATSSIFSTNSSEKKITVPKKTSKDALDIKRLAAHEIGVHAAKTTKLDGDVEEGLGILVECVVVGKADNIAYNRSRRRYMAVGLALGADGHPPRNARQVFEIMWRIEAMAQSKDGSISADLEAKTKRTTKSHIENIFRGTDYALPGALYPKAKVYLEGIRDAIEYAERYAEDLEWLAKVLSGEYGDLA